MMSNIPKQTAEIFNILTKGLFISSNGSQARLYEILNDELHHTVLKDYFSHIGFSLETGYNYFYFSQADESAGTIERKLEQFAHFIDILDFFSCLDSKPVPGTRYRISQVAEECYTNERLKQKIFALSRKDKLIDKVAEIADYLANSGFLEKEDEELYKVLDSIHYLEQIISMITIDDDGEDTTA